MSEKGQVAIEFIMLILIILIYLLTITRPLVDNSKELAEDVQLIVRTDSESKRIVNSINQVAMLGEGTKKTLQLHIPNNGIIFCEDNSISFSVNFQKALSAPVSNCDDGSCCEGINCKKKFVFSENISLDCRKEEMFGNTPVIIRNNGITDGKTEVVLTG